MSGIKSLFGEALDRIAELEEELQRERQAGRAIAESLNAALAEAPEPPGRETVLVAKGSRLGVWQVSRGQVITDEAD